MTEIITQTFDILDPIDTQAYGGGTTANFADVVQYLPQAGFRFLNVVEAEVSADVPGFWIPGAVQNSGPSALGFTVRFRFEEGASGIPVSGRFVAAFYRD